MPPALPDKKGKRTANKFPFMQAVTKCLPVHDPVISEDIPLVQQLHEVLGDQELQEVQEDHQNRQCQRVQLVQDHHGRPHHLLGPVYHRDHCYPVRIKSVQHNEFKCTQHCSLESPMRETKAMRQWQWHAKRYQLLQVKANLCTTEFR